jgi:hypothetical protein
MGGGGKGGGDFGRSEELFGFARNLFKLGKKSRSTIFSLLQDALEGGDLAQRPFFNPVAQQIERQTDESRRRLLATLPQGGALNRGITNLETGRLQARSGALTTIRQGLFNEALNTAFGRSLNPAQGFAGLGVQGATAANQAEQAAQAAQLQALGSAAGQFGGFLGGLGGDPTTDPGLLSSGSRGRLGASGFNLPQFF